MFKFLFQQIDSYFCQMMLHGLQVRVMRNVRVETGFKSNQHRKQFALDCSRRIEFEYRSERHNMARKAYEIVVCLQHRRVHVTQRDAAHVGKIMLRKELNERQTVQESIHHGIRNR